MNGLEVGARVRIWMGELAGLEGTVYSYVRGKNVGVAVPLYPSFPANGERIYYYVPKAYVEVLG